MSKVAILGIGVMGSRMAVNLLKSGHAVTVWNRDANKLSPLLAMGARPATSPRSAAGEAEFVISMVRDDEASRNIWIDEKNGALAGMTPNAVAIESSTLTVKWMKVLGAHCTEQGIAFLDAPVAGSRPQAEATQLIYFVGGEAAVVERTEPILLAMGKEIHHTGAIGSATAVKLMVNALFGIQLATLGELLGFLRRLGVDEAKAIEALAATPACSPAVKIASDSMLKGNFAPLFPLELVAKDFSYVVQTAALRSANVPLSATANTVFTKALEDGYGQDNITGIVQLYR